MTALMARYDALVAAGELRPDPAAFAGWFRRSERFVVPVERGTFSTGGGFELLHYAEGYYNGMARSFPSAASLSMIGPPGYPSPSSFATLSYASPAASSLVRASRRYTPGSGTR